MVLDKPATASVVNWAMWMVFADCSPQGCDNSLHSLQNTKQVVFLMESLCMELVMCDVIHCIPMNHVQHTSHWMSNDSKTS